MPIKSYLIGGAGKQGGLQTNVKPFWLADQSYSDLLNVMAWRDRVRKKPGWSVVGRLQLNLSDQSLGNTQSDGSFSGNLISALSLEATASIVLGSISITVGGQTFTDDSMGNLSNGGSGTGTINYATGDVAFQTDPTLASTAITIDFSYYPGLPVLGITNQQTESDQIEEGVFFDTTYSYNYVDGSFQEYPSNTPTTWTNPTNSNLFWYTNYYATVLSYQALWVTNNIDNIRYYDLASSPPTWTTFTPTLYGSTTLNACLLMVPFKGRLLAFNTFEGTTRYQQRLRYSQSTLIGPPTASEAWRSDIPGKGGFIDAPTSQAIISLKNIKDRLVVYFERSTWEVVYTGNETLPFVFRQLNQELGSESTFSTVPFDNGVLGIGSVGIHTCNGVNVVRFDELIPDEVFKIDNQNEGPQRVSAVRDYQLETVYWSFPDTNQFEAQGNISGLIYPNKIFMYNYRNSTWAEFVESFTCFGYFQPNEDATWATLEYDTWSEWDDPWNDALDNSLNPVVCSGNQQGFVFTFGKEKSAATDYSRYIQAVSGSQITSPDHNLNSGDYVVFNYGDILGISFIQNGITYSDPSVTPPPLSFQITSIVDKDNFIIDGSTTGSYIGNGLIQKLDNFYISTKQFNPFLDQGKQVRFSSVDFLVDNQSIGGFQANFYLNDSQSNYNNIPLNGTNEIDLSPSPLVPSQVDQETIWKRKCVNAVGQFIQIEMTHSDSQMRDPLISQSEFVLHALNIRLDESGRINPS